MRIRSSRGRCSAVCSAIGTAALLVFATSAPATPIPTPTVTVSKTASTSFTQTYVWDIEKTVDDPELTLRVGETATVNYSVAVEKTTTESDWAVTGSIQISNPYSTPTTITGISDVVGSVAAIVNCGESLPYVLAPGATLTCTYSASLLSAVDGTNVVTVTTVEGASASASADYMFSGASITTIGYSSVTIADSWRGDFGSISDDTLITYIRQFQFAEAGFYSFDNFASIYETGQGDSARVEITVVPEPATLSLIGLALVGLAATRRRKH